MTAAQADLLALVATQADTGAAWLADFAERPRPSVRRDLAVLVRLKHVYRRARLGEGHTTYEATWLGLMKLDAMFSGEC